MDNNSIKCLQNQFFGTLQEIQDIVVNVSLSGYYDGCDIENLLYDATYETIYKIMELFDGYVKQDLQLDIVDSVSGSSIKTGIELHDKCVDFIKCEK